MSFITPLGLIALLGVPAVFALHLFRRRFKQRRVGGLFLFSPDHLRATAGRKRTKLLRSASLLCELAAAVLLALWLGGLAFGFSSQAVHAVIVLDDSASMSATHQGESVADRVRDSVATYIEGLPAGSYATVILTGARPEILVGPRELAGTVPNAIADWRPWRPSHDLRVALDLGVELAGEHGELRFYTDRIDAGEIPDGYEARAFGRADANAAMLAARRHRGASGERLYADVCAFSTEPLATELAVYALGNAGVRELVRREVTLQPDEPQHLQLKIPVTDSPVSIKLGGDALAVDDEFLLFPQPRRTVRVAITLDEEHRRALELERVLAVLPNVEFEPDLEKSHLVIGADPDGSRHEVLLGAIGADLDTWLGPYLIERRDELCDGLTFDGVVWSSGRGTLEGFPVVLAGEQPLISRDGGPERLRLRINLDPRRSNFSTSPDWPILLTNVCDAVRAVLPGTTEPNVLVGGLLRWRAEAAAGSGLRMIDPFGRERPGRGLRLVTWSARYPGEHRLMRDGTEQFRFSVNFADAHESDLRDRESAERERLATETREANIGSADAGRSEGRLLALLLLAVIVLDWFVLRRAGGGA